MSVERDPLLRAIATVLTDQPRLPMEQLAQAIGISRATLHRMFPNREAIVEAVLALALESSRQAIDGAAIDEGPADEALRRLVATFMPNAVLYLFLQSAHQERCGQADTWLAEFEPNRQRVLALFRRGQEEGCLRVDLTAQWMHDATSALLFEAAHSVREGRLAAADAVESVLAVLLDGARRRPAPAPGSASASGRSAAGRSAAGLASALIVPLALWGGMPASGHAVEVEGVHFDDTVALGGATLSVNGTGLREVYIVKTWVAALYTPGPVRSAQALIADPGPRRLAISLLADVSIDRIARGILDAIRRNHDPLLLASIDAQIKAFVATLRAIGPTQKGDRLTLDLAEGSTRVSFNDMMVGEPIAGLLFRDALLRAFVGAQPIDVDLQRGLLGLPPQEASGQVGPADAAGAARSH
jgi:AcrR family transcriptional regulator